MLFIVNKTQKTIIISDLNIPLGPRQAIDLDKKVGRDRAEKSKDLLRLIHDKSIEVKIKDAAPSLIPAPEIKQTNPVPSQTIDVDKLKQDITKEIIASFKDVANEIKEHVSQNKSVTTIVQNSSSETKEQEDDMALADEILANIHAKAVDKMVKDTSSGRVNCEETTIQNNVNKNISELENLI